MRTVEVLSIVAALGGAFVNYSQGLERKLVRRLTAAAATSPDDAIAVGQLNPVARWRLARLLKAGAVVTPEPKHYFFDEAVYRGLRHRRRVRALVVAAVLIVAVAAILVAR